MKIVYYANHGNGRFSDDTEGHIAHSLRSLGHDVIEAHEKENAVPDGDLLLFHKGGDHIWDVLKQFNGQKVLWYFDKVWHDRPLWFRRILPLVDLAFLTDETWAARNLDPKFVVLRQGIGDRDLSLGKPRQEFRCKVAFTGSVYGQRAEWVEELRKRFGNDFRVFNDVFNRNLFDLCASADIVLAPPFPSDDNYWSSRIYMILGSGGFLLHPKLKGLDKEYKEGFHYVGYSATKELLWKIDYYLSHPVERGKIKAAGFKKTAGNYTYTKRCQNLLQEIQARLDIGTGA